MVPRNRGHRIKKCTCCSPWSITGSGLRNVSARTRVGARQGIFAVLFVSDTRRFFVGRAYCASPPREMRFCCSSVELHLHPVPHSHCTREATCSVHISLARSLATAVHPSSCTAPCSSLPLYEGSDVFRPYLARSLTGASSDTPFVASLELQRFSISCGDVCRGGRRSYVRVRLRPCRYRLRAASRRER